MFVFVKTFHFLIHAISDFQSVTIFLASTVLSTIKTKFGPMWLSVSHCSGCSGCSGKLRLTEQKHSFLSLVTNCTMWTFSAQITNLEVHCLCKCLLLHQSILWPLLLQATMIWKTRNTTFNTYVHLFSPTLSPIRLNLYHQYVYYFLAKHTQNNNNIILII